MPPIPPSLMIPANVVDTQTPNPMPSYQRAVGDLNRELQQPNPMPPGGGNETPQLQYNPPPIMSFQQFAEQHYPQATRSPMINPYLLKQIGADYERYFAAQGAMARQQAVGDELMLRREREGTYREGGVLGGRGTSRGRAQTPQQMLEQLYLLETIQRIRGDDPEAPVSKILQEYQRGKKGPGSAKEMLEEAVYKAAMEMFPDDPYKAMQWAGEATRRQSESSEEKGLMSSSDVSRMFAGESLVPGTPPAGGIAQAAEKYGPVAGYLWARKKIERFGAGLSESQRAKIEQYVEAQRPSVEELYQEWSSGKFQDAEYLGQLRDAGVITQEEFDKGVGGIWDWGNNEDVSDELARLAYYRVLEMALSPEDFEKFKAYVKQGK